MLLRLLPTPSPSQPTPPTILFTLPLPNSPYTSRALPLPPNLLAHRSLCLQEDIECGNVLLGDKATWISGIVDNVTFSLPHSTILVHLVDGRTLNLDLSDECVATLHRVVREVQLSFAAAAAPPPTPPPAASPAASPRSSMSSERSACSGTLSPASAAGRRTPGALLFSLLSPLLPTSPRAQTPAHVAAHQQPARAHRRQARSLLVDAYRRYVLPTLKERLPTHYLVWAIQSEAGSKMDEFVTLRDDICHMLSEMGIEFDPTAECSFSRSVTPRSPSISTAASSSEFGDATSNNDEDSDPSSPTGFLLRIPPAHTVPLRHRSAYSQQVTRVSELAGRVGSITQLASRYECEENKRKWLDQLDLQRDAEKAVRRAFSNRLLPATDARSAVPVRRSSLSQSVTAQDIERAARQPIGLGLAHIPEDDYAICSDSDMESLPEPELSDDRSSAFASPEPQTPTYECDDAPPLVPSHSDDSLSDRDDWDREAAPSPEPEFDSRKVHAVSTNAKLPEAPTSFVALPWSALDVF
ncbi:hypothetical protein CcaverHIS002_0206210 [Cutaneotrichosporon cavernicola]|uniref:Uncharacterized protein n=1 Tax=Cutaneotrichosporon cavernicola TaxID=279322 RepID=A0AA48L195_9TREE|nr:uncharacterized protein CcaverHIS019_0206170 [Cutaneotrichosporon cavernicola]BEI81461.1 hypothetical protein CcaverHIS002_0206210 [Cutaneotrichosporon cavernicola]BEI89255.1 hypothetical protein CcaverHIS019_0206170 [Cutaneotrichosporon cavernicola]BEI97031.1 hypothetical protein CcaverHIS631_0206200 [Cutaneotrichosporon cavernicola]BEJ04805.1 hypothetical protein CcaverHIS641_0206220 [Cutaneotrichosporon cavernicola]